MALNKNHEFEELDGVKCGIVEKNVSPARLAFIKDLLEYNGYTVVSVPTPPPKAVPLAKPVEPVVQSQPLTSNIEPPTSNIEPQTFTVGVTDYTFNTINAIFGRMLKSRDGNIVTLAFWQQKENSSHDEIPYYEHS